MAGLAGTAGDCAGVVGAGVEVDGSGAATVVEGTLVEGAAVEGTVVNGVVVDGVVVAGAVADGAVVEGVAAGVADDDDAVVGGVGWTTGPPPPPPQAVNVLTMPRLAVSFTTWLKFDFNL